MTESTDEVFGESESHQTDRSSSDPTVIYPLIADSGNERVLREWLDAHEEYTLVEDEPVDEALFDICLADQPALIDHSESIRAAKTAAKPALLPVLLLVSDLDTDLLSTEHNELVDNVLATTVDEFISLPIRKAELEWRLHTLRQLREQSLDLKTQNDKLRRFRRAIEASGHGIIITDTDGTIEYTNPAFEATTGYSNQEAVGNNTNMLQSGKMNDSHYDQLWQTISAGETWHGEIVDQRKDGSQYIVDQTIAPISDASGEITAYVAVQTDITERKQLEDRLKQHRDIVQRLDDPIMLQNEDGQFELVNQALCDFAGLSAEKLEGTDEYEFMDEPTAKFIHRQKKAVLWTEKPVTYSVTPTFEYSGKEAVFYTTRYPYYNEESKLVGTLAICRDVTDLDRRTRHLQVIDNILRHNIRNKLTIIKGRGTQIQRDTNGELTHAAASIVEAADDLLTTSEKSRQITQVFSNDTNITQINLSDTIERIINNIKHRWPDIKFSVTIPDEVVVIAIPEIGDAIKELVENAAMHNDKETSQVELSVTVDNEVVEIQISDNGPGMIAFDQEVLESGTAIGELSHGSGLGLWLVYWIVQQSNGTINLTDQDSSGTTVNIKLPVPSAQ
ncbi:PAS domain S-box protein [Halonotius sp. F2-221B]|uniref:PAS domain-containing protein n=1 Tax=Halonotius sp. F2-221B TaxID=2731620 RepID=UPI00398BB9E9